MYFLPKSIKTYKRLDERSFESYINDQRDDSNQLKNKKVEVAFHRSDVVYKVFDVHFGIYKKIEV